MHLFRRRDPPEHHFICATVARDVPGRRNLLD
jgi:hypothetical protein